LSQFLGLFWTAFQDWRRDRADRLGAALAYYTIFSIPPLLLLILGLAGLVFGRESVQGRILATLGQLFGPQGAAAIGDILTRMNQQGRSATATLVGVGTLLLGASGVFGHLKDTLDTIWNVRQEKGAGLKGWVQGNIFSIVVLMGAAFLLVVSLAVNALLAAVGDLLARSLPGGAFLWGVVNVAVSLAVLAALFALMFRYIPAAKVRWRDAVVGGLVTSVLFVAGEAAIGFYLGKSNVGSAFGVAGSLVVLLVWVYYSALIFFYGAEFTQAYAALREPRGVEGAQVRRAGVR
jgi:membrane protein